MGDPHIHTVDGKFYDFQAAGEFILLRDRDGLEIQARQTPLETANPITDSYTGLTSSVSVNTAVAARVGSHQISYQPTGVGANSQLQFFLDGEPARLSTAGIDLEGHRVSARGNVWLSADDLDLGFDNPDFDRYSYRTVFLLVKFDHLVRSCGKSDLALRSPGEATQKKRAVGSSTTLAMLTRLQRDPQDTHLVV